ncbi:polysaccharide biosynthesis/export family protein [Pseudofulvibacter geojedonensis]|uniref:Polysaccharide biosynthesis/export family protein n=1 Tax=Pseudofulvibacter geojedonensis TaxID=1123758 RepID=A0ABW3HYJ0_9FLAO
MNFKLFLVFLLGSLFFTSCISRKQTVYFQNKKNAELESAFLNKQLPPYRVQINDVLSIRIKALDQKLVGMFNPIASEDNVNATSGQNLYFDGFLVDDHGDVNIPTLGKVNVLNLTVEEIKEKIKSQLLKEYFKKEANIFLTVKLSGVKYTILGEIKRPGTSILYQERVNIFEAIANSGDIPVLGDKKDVLILRPFPGGHKIHHLDLTDSKILESPFFYVQPNDMIYIKPLPQKSWGTGTNGLQTFTTIMSVFTALTTTILLFRTLN